MTHNLAPLRTSSPPAELARSIVRIYSQPQAALDRECKSIGEMSVIDESVSGEKNGSWVKEFCHCQGQISGTLTRIPGYSGVSKQVYLPLERCFAMLLVLVRVQSRLPNFSSTENQT